jgi:VIT1/CCC1 family predicted Fe2+/Mn2+ transporter
MARRFASKHLDYSDLVTESAIAVYMVIIINGYVSLSQLNTEFYYILAVDLGACLAWGFIDGFTYGISGSIERGNQAKVIQMIQNEKDSERAINEVVEKLDDTFVEQYSEAAKISIASEILKNSSTVSAVKKGFMTREDLGGMASIIALYLAAGVILSFPYIILPNKIDAWALSNGLGIAWLFFYGYRVGGILGEKRILIGFVTMSAGIVFLTVSYLVYA